jgi:hypothetical protein
MDSLRSTPFSSSLREAIECAGLCARSRKQSTCKRRSNQTVMRSRLSSCRTSRRCVAQAHGEMGLGLLRTQSQDGAFDEYVKDVDAVEHMASPVHFNFDDPKEAIVPAVNGTTSIIKSVIAYGYVSKYSSVLYLPRFPHPIAHADRRPGRMSSAWS